MAVGCQVSDKSESEKNSCLVEILPYSLIIPGVCSSFYLLARIARGYRDFHVRREDRRMRGEEQNSPRGLEVTVVNSDLVHDRAGAR